MEIRLFFTYVFMISMITFLQCTVEEFQEEEEEVDEMEEVIPKPELEFCITVNGEVHHIQAVEFPTLNDLVTTNLAKGCAGDSVWIARYLSMHKTDKFSCDTEILEIGFDIIELKDKDPESRDSIPKYLDKLMKERSNQVRFTLRYHKDCVEYRNFYRTTKEKKIVTTNFNNGDNYSYTIDEYHIDRSEPYVARGFDKYLLINFKGSFQGTLYTHPAEELSDSINISCEAFDINLLHFR